MEYSVKQLAELAGVSARTLRYYDSIGLLSPARVTDAGYRLYGPVEVDLLQQILLYRALGLELSVISRIVHEPSFDRLEALRSQKAWLEAQREELNHLIDTVDNTIRHAEGGTPMNDTEKFEGLKRRKIEENEAKYGAEIREKYGEDTVNKSNQKFQGLSEAQYNKLEALGKKINAALEAAVRAGEDPAGDAGRKIAEMHRDWLCLTWPQYSAQAHRGLAEMYLADERFTAYYDGNVTGCAQFLHDAIHVHCKD